MRPDCMFETPCTNMADCECDRRGFAGSSIGPLMGMIMVGVLGALAVWFLL
jgi:hypothetical protein